MYTKTIIPSSFQENDLGKTLYDLVSEIKPNKIIEFGTLHGYSAIAMAQALKDLEAPRGPGRPSKKEERHIYSYDLWDEYTYNKGRMEVARSNAEKYGVSEYITFLKGDLAKWEPEPFDMMFVDISNTGETLTLLSKKTKGMAGIVYFEGGTTNRDTVSWMTKYNKQPMRSAGIKYDVIEEKFPGISRLI